MESLIEFWYIVEKKLPEISRKPLHALIPFATSYFCEYGFSAVVVTKCKYRAKLDISKITPRYDKLIKCKEAHPSHWA